MSLDFDIAGKVAVVTGASSGLGLRIAKTLGAQGARVVVAARRTEIINKVAAEIETDGGQAHAIRIDVSSLQSIQAFAERVEQRVGAIEILINNAGVSRQVPLEEVDESYYDWIMDTNTKGAFFLAQAAARQMVRRKIPGRIVNIASVGGMAAMPKPGRLRHVEGGDDPDDPLAGPGPGGQRHQRQLHLPGLDPDCDQPEFSEYRRRSTHDRNVTARAARSGRRHGCGAAPARFGKRFTIDYRCRADRGRWLLGRLR